MKTIEVFRRFDEFQQECMMQAEREQAELKSLLDRGLSLNKRLSEVLLRVQEIRDKLFINQPRALEGKENEKPLSSHQRNLDISHSILDDLQSEVADILRQL